MGDLPRLDKNVIGVSALDDAAEEKRYWLTRDPRERLNALEHNRRMVYGHDRTSAPLQKRIFEVVELPRG